MFVFSHECVRARASVFVRGWEAGWSNTHFSNVSTYVALATPCRHSFKFDFISSMTIKIYTSFEGKKKTVLWCSKITSVDLAVGRCWAALCACQGTVKLSEPQTFVIPTLRWRDGVMFTIQFTVVNWPKPGELYCKLHSCCLLAVLTLSIQGFF